MIAMSVRQPTRSGAFTILELLIVISIIIILAGLVLSVSSYVQHKGASSRAEAEIAAISAAIENYKADNGVYPRDANTDALDARTPANCDPRTGLAAYRDATLSLYKLLSGDTAANHQPTSKSYFTFPLGMLYPKGSATSVTALVDPWGNCYGYSTANQTSASQGFNPTFDLWSSGIPDDSGAANVNPAKFLKNW